MLLGSAIDASPSTEPSEVPEREGLRAAFPAFPAIPAITFRRGSSILVHDNERTVTFPSPSGSSVTRRRIAVHREWIVQPKRSRGRSDCDGSNSIVMD